MMTKTYSKRIIWIHWLSSLLIIVLIISGIMMEEEPDMAKKLRLYQWHFPIGITVFVLTLLRVFAYFRDSRPDGLYPEGHRRQKLIHFVHNGFYWVILWMCVSGIISLFVENIIPALQTNTPSLLPDLTKDLSVIMLSHHIVAKFVMLLLIMHVVGIFSHIIKTKQNVFKRIW